MGVDSFILSRDVTAALIREGVVDKAPTSKGAMGPRAWSTVMVAAPNSRSPAAAMVPPSASTIT